jgi:hypothetical protein
MSLKDWNYSVSQAKKRLGISPEKFTRIQGRLLREAQTIYHIILMKKNIGKK